MSAPSKPRPRPAPAPTPLALTAPPPGLAPTEMHLSSREVQLLLAYRNLKPSAQISAARVMERWANDPVLRSRPNPKLRMIVGGAA